MSVDIYHVELPPLSAEELLKCWAGITARILGRSAGTVAAGRWVFTGFRPTAVITRRVAGPRQARAARIAPMGVRTTWSA
jgi:hypothetical protein